MLKIAIIGTGNISRLHIEGYQEFSEKCRIVALCDIVPAKAEAMKANYNLAEAKIYESYQDMLSEGGFDLASICTPPFCHAEISINALKAGVNVLVEKPMAASLEECDQMLAAERESGKILSVIAQNRFRDPIKNLKAVLDSNLAGRVLHAQVDSFWWRGHSYYDLWWRGRWDREGGGCTLNHAVHHIDMLLWMMGEPDKVTALLSNAAHNNAEVEDISLAALRYPNGALSQITSSVIHHGEEQQLIFQCEKARISAPWQVYASISQPNGFPVENKELAGQLDDFVTALPQLNYEGHTAQIEDVLKAVENGTRPSVGGIDGRRTIALICAIYRAGTLKRETAFTIDKDDDFYTVEGILKSVPRFFEKTASVDELGGTITVGSNYKYF
ncbi:MAG: Gfo/Idh/MocA family oxidoreductase [Lachnospiraceae bacterium]|nr:Gfo/Idh/MocA family oxidoreductase [Lachnospiraceae bacterium]